MVLCLEAMDLAQKEKKDSTSLVMWASLGECV
jgi:hypothetical protein